MTYDEETAERELADRALERADSPQIHLGPLDPCPDCGALARETSPGHWRCACEVVA